MSPVFAVFIVLVLALLFYWGRKEYEKEEEKEEERGEAEEAKKLESLPASDAALLEKKQLTCSSIGNKQIRAMCALKCGALGKHSDVCANASAQCYRLLRVAVSSRLPQAVPLSLHFRPKTGTMKLLRSFCPERWTRLVPA